MATHPQAEHAETRERILDAAEMLFAENGFDATSIRDITTEAACNVASVNYHFGGKENLYTETFRRLLGDLRDVRISTIEQAMQSEDEPTLEYFLETFANAFLDPLIDKNRGARFMAYYAREMVEAHLPPEVLVNEFVRPLLIATTAQLEQTGPQLNPMSARLCVMSVVGQLIHSLKAIRYIADQEGQDLVPSEIDEHIRHVVKFSAGGIRACAPSKEA